MNKFNLFLFCLFISVSATGETVYKNTNPDGSVTFTDQPSTESEEVKIRKPTTYKPVRLPSLNLPTKKLSPTFNYSITIEKPAMDTVITDNSDVVVSVSVSPQLKKTYGHQLRYNLGGDSKQSEKLSITFKNISRGTHSLRVVIVDRAGKVVSPVASSTFHMKRFFKKPAKPAPKVP